MGSDLPAMTAVIQTVSSNLTNAKFKFKLSNSSGSDLVTESGIVLSDLCNGIVRKLCQFDPDHIFVDPDFLTFVVSHTKG